MSDDNLSLITHPGASLALGTRSGGRIVTEMVGETLALTKTAVRTGAELVPRFNIGDHLFCDPEYQQIMLWARTLQIEPSKVVGHLLSEPDPAWPVAS